MNISEKDRKQIEASIREKYEKVAAGEPGLFKYPTGRAGLAGLGYYPAWLQGIPGQVQDCFCGVGNPFSVGLPGRGNRVVDVGCGCGVDTLVSAKLTGPEGKAVGIETSLDMLARAKKNAEESGVHNVEFLEGNAESLPLPDNTFDLLTSSGVYNLVIDKPKAFSEAYRVLKPGGRLQIADQVLIGPPPMSQADMVASWFT